MTTAIEDLDELTVASATVKINDETLEIGEVPYFKYGELMKAADPILAQVLMLKFTEEGEDGSAFRASLGRLVVDGGEHLKEVLAIACDIHPSRVETWNTAQVIRVTEIVVGLNHDFFFQQILPRVTVIREKIHLALLKSSSPSSPTDTAGQTSSDTASGNSTPSTAKSKSKT